MHHAHAAAVAGGSGSPPSAARRRRAGSGERRPAGHADSRLPQVLDAAAQLFCHFGYQGATLRGIAQAVDMLPGSIYSHFAAKEDLLVAVYRRGVDQIIAAVEQAVQPQGSAWARLEAACIAHLEAILRDDDYARVVVRVRPAELGRAAARLVRERDRYEALWVALIQALPMPPGTDRRSLRLLLLGALNWSPHWYRPRGPATPRRIARRFLALLRRGDGEALP
jgi:AcrR family transcriptional regulator